MNRLTSIHISPTIFKMKDAKLSIDFLIITAVSSGIFLLIANVYSSSYNVVAFGFELAILTTFAIKMYQFFLIVKNKLGSELSFYQNTGSSLATSIILVSGFLFLKRYLNFFSHRNKINRINQNCKQKSPIKTPRYRTIRKTYKWLLTLIVFCSYQLVSAQSSPDTLIVGYTAAPPFIINEGDQLEGINIWLWKKIAGDLDIAYKLEPMDFSDMLEALKQGAIDVSINPLTITSERSKSMNFTHSYYASNSTVVIHETSVFQKFSKWILSFFSFSFLRGLLGLLLVIFFFGIITWHVEKKKNTDQFRQGWNGVWDGVWWSVVTMTTVGYGDKSPKSRTGKLIALIWMFSGLLFISGLTASITSTLTVNQLKSDPKSFSEFKDLNAGCIKNTSTNEFLKERFFKNVHLYENVGLGLESLKKDEIDTFLYDEPILRYRIQQDSTLKDLRILPLRFDLQFYAFGLSKNNSVLEEMISQKILEITESLQWQIILNEYNLTEI